MFLRLLSSLPSSETSNSSLKFIFSIMYESNNNKKLRALPSSTESFSIYSLPQSNKL